VRGSPAAGPLLSAHLDVFYQERGKVLSGCEIEIGHGEVFGLAGPSGSGKSSFALAVLRLLDSEQASVRGRVEFEGADLLQLNERQMRQVRGRQIGLVPQSPLESLNPVLRIGAQLREAWEVHRPDHRQDWKREVLQALRAVSLPADEPFLRRFPRELSVGMAQRVLIAMAVLHRPKLLIADEATSALDVITQAEVLQLLRRLHEDYGMAILFITHDLLAAATLCQTLAVLRQGEIVECAPVRRMFERPMHPYTQELIAALPRPAWLDGPEKASAWDAAHFPASTS